MARKKPRGDYRIVVYFILIAMGIGSMLTVHLWGMLPKISTLVGKQQGEVKLDVRVFVGGDESATTLKALEDMGLKIEVTQSFEQSKQASFESDDTQSDGKPYYQTEIQVRNVLSEETPLEDSKDHSSIKSEKEQLVDLINRGVETYEANLASKNDPIHYCHRNSNKPECCSEEHCKIVRQSSIYSLCCGNIPRKVAGNKMGRIYPLLITGTPRSGTQFMRNLIQALDGQVTSDWQSVSKGKDGMVSWMHIMHEPNEVWFGSAKLQGSKFHSVWRQVRDPLKGLTSIAYTEPIQQPGYLDFLNRHITVEDWCFNHDRSQYSRYQCLLKQSLQFFNQWHKFLNDLKINTYRLEDLALDYNMTILDEIFMSMGLPSPNHEKALNIILQENNVKKNRTLTQTNARHHRTTLEWWELCQVDKSLTDEFLQLSKDWGYYLEVQNPCDKAAMNHPPAESAYLHSVWLKPAITWKIGKPHPTTTVSNRSEATVRGQDIAAPLVDKDGEEEPHDLAVTQEDRHLNVEMVAKKTEPPHDEGAEIPSDESIMADRLSSSAEKIIEEPSLYCDRNAEHPDCCSKEQCQVVRRSTMYSTCCGNLPESLVPERSGKLYPVLITGTPRSGTEFMQVLINNLGGNVTHDWKSVKYGKDGMVSWMHIRKDPTNTWYGPGTLDGSKFFSVWHQLRDPLKGLTSLAFSEPIQKPGYLPFLRRHIQVSGWCYGGTMAPYEQYKCLLQQGLEFYNQWHKFIIKLKIRTFKLEDVVLDYNLKVLDEIFASMNLSPPDHGKALSFIRGNDKHRRLRVVNSRMHRPTLEWWELCQVSKSLTAEFLRLSQIFDYYNDVEDPCDEAALNHPPPTAEYLQINSVGLKTKKASMQSVTTE